MSDRNLALAAELRAVAMASVVNDQNAHVRRLVSDDAEWRRVIRAQFGVARGEEALRRGPSAVMEIAASACERHARAAAMRHHSYDMPGHLACQALYRAAQERMRGEQSKWNAAVTCAASVNDGRAA